MSSDHSVQTANKKTSTLVSRRRRGVFTFKHLGQGLALVLGRVAELDVLVGVPGDSLPVQRHRGVGAGFTVIPQREGVWNVPGNNKRLQLNSSLFFSNIISPLIIMGNFFL